MSLANDPFPRSSKRIGIFQKIFTDLWGRSNTTFHTISASSFITINAFINELDLKNITAQQTQQLTEFQAKAIANFDKRFVHAMLSFLFLSMTPFFLPQLNKKVV